MHDLVVAGGGPVGLATALYAARAGLDVVVREPRAGAIDKACGEGLMPGAVAALAELGVPLDGRPIGGIRYLDGARTAETRFRHGAGRGVRRTTLHEALRTTAEQRGVPTEHEAVGEVVDRGEFLVVDGEPCRYLVAADGLHSPVRRMLDLDGPPVRAGRRPGRRRFGLRSHVAVEPWTDLVEVHWSPVGEAYVTPVADGQVGVAVLSSEGRPFDQLLPAFPRLAERIAGHERTRPRGAGPLRQRSTRRVSGRTLLVGDAAGYVDALTGEGIALGLSQAWAAVAAFVADDPQRYEAEWRRLGRRHDLLTRALLTATSVAPVRSNLVRVAARLPTVFGAAVDQLAKPA